MGLACVLMAAGVARRFGGDKIFARFEGEALYTRALRTAQDAGCFERIALICRAQDAPRIYAPGVRVLINETGERSATIRTGVEAFCEMEGIVFMACDQPLLTPQSLSGLARAFWDDPQGIFALSVQGKERSPVLFPSAYYNDLRSLRGEEGGKVVIRLNPQALRMTEAPEWELFDADTPQELATLARLKRENAVPPGRNT